MRESPASKFSIFSINSLDTYHTTKLLTPGSQSKISAVPSLSCVLLFAAPWTACQASLSITNSQSLLKLMSIGSVIPSNHLILCHLLLLPPSIFPSIRVFSNESALRIRWPKYWSFSFSISPSNEYSGLISFRIDWLDLLVVQGTLKSLLQHHSSKASIQCKIIPNIYPHVLIFQFLTTICYSQLPTNPHFLWILKTLFLFGQ